MRLIDPTGLYGYDTQTGQISHSDGTITDTKGNVISTPPSAGGSGSSDSGSTDSGSLSPSTPTPDPSGDSGSGEETKKTPTGEQESIGANTDKKPEGDTKNIADDIEKEKSQQIAVVIKEEVKITEIPIGRYLKAEVKVSLDVTQKPEGDYYTITVGPNGKMRITDEDGKSVNIVRETIASIGIKVAEITQVELSNGSKITCSLSFQADGKGAIQVFSSSYHSPNNGPVTTVSLKTSDQLEQDLNAAAFVAAQVWSSVQQVATDPNTYKAAAAVAGLILAF